MTKKNSTDRRPSNEGHDAGPDASPKGRISNPAKILLAVAIVACAVVGAYKLGFLESIFRSAGFPNFGDNLTPVFTRLPDDNVLSGGNLLAGVGKIPADDSGVGPQVVVEPLSPTGSQDKTFSAPTDGPTQAQAEQPRSREIVPRDQQRNTPVSPAQPLIAPRPVETSVIPSGLPSPTEDKNKTKIPLVSSGSEQSAPQETRPDKTAESSPTKESVVKPPVRKETPDWNETTRSEQFRLPGSLLVKIHNYSGSSVTWGLAVILDDSESMARQTKMWNPNRLTSAVDFVAKLPGSLTPNSRLVVRDFFCGKSGDTDKKARCLNHMLFEWSSSPFKQLREVLEKAHPGGQTDPCAAAAYSAKNDFKGLGNLTPRILIVTNGASKCGYATVLKAVYAHESKEKISVDVLALGMSKKRHRGYSSLAGKTNGLMLEMDKPADIDQAVSRYAKVLKAKAMEKVEVKGDKAVTSISPFQEVALAPGAYTVVLPVVEGLSPSKRTITGVKINPGETNVMDVTIKKGHPIVRVGRK